MYNIVILVFAILLCILLFIKAQKNEQKVKKLDEKYGESKQTVMMLKLEKEKNNNLENDLVAKRKDLEKKRMEFEEKVEDFYIVKKNELESFSKKQSKIDLEMKNLNKLSEKINTENRIKQAYLEEYEVNLNEERIEKLSHLSSYSIEQAKKELFATLEEELSDKFERELKIHKENLLLNKKEISRQILLDAMEVTTVDTTNEFAVKTISIPNDDIKGKLIGREGRNVKSLESGLGVNLIIDDTPGQIQISSFNSRRRAVAKICIKELVRTAKINQTLIEEGIEKANREIDELIITKGKEAIYKFGIHDMDFNLVKQIGTLHLRSSYGQNVLKHSIEAAEISVKIAQLLDLDVTLAARCLLLHDIGKNESAEIAVPHAELGYELATEFGENEIVTNAIRAHHGDCETESYYAVITMIADMMSASRQGSRREQFDDFVKRVKDLEAIALELKEVRSAFALQGGRELRVLVIPDKISDNKLEVLSRKIEKEIQEKMVFPGKIKIHIIREKRYTRNVKMGAKNKEQNG